MKLRLFVLLVAAFVFAAVLAPMQSVNADAYVNTYTLACAGFSASGTSDQAYVTLYASPDDGSGDAYFVVIPVVNGSYSGGLTFPEHPEGTAFSIEVWGTLAPYITFDDPNYWDSYEYFYSYEPCVKQVFTGPGIPADYVLRTIICETPVYDTPAGRPVGNAAVHVAQTFFVNPVPETAADGTSWTRIFVSSSPNPYIPTSCIQ